MVGVSALSEAVDDYLHLRRSLGYKLEQHGPLLLGFADYLLDLGLDHVTIEAAVAWATLPQRVEPVWWHQRLGIVRGFAVHQSTIDPRTEVPPKGLLVRPTKRRTPYLFADSEVISLMEAAGRLRYPLKAATYEMLIGLLASTGMRTGEAIRLDRDHVDLHGGSSPCGTASSASPAGSRCMRAPPRRSPPMPVAATSCARTPEPTASSYHCEAPGWTTASSTPSSAP
jgi:integrase/recombinase XerD